MDKYDVFQYPTLVMKKLGIFSKINFTRNKILASAYMLIAAYILVACVIQIFYVNGDVAAFTGNLEAIGGMAQTLVKCWAIGFRTNDFLRLIDYTKRFWETDRCSTELKAKLDKILYRNIQIQRMILLSLMVSVFLANSAVIFGLSLPTGTWTMEGHRYFYYTVLVVEVTFMPAIGILLGAFDCLFLALCSKTVVQFRILCYCIENIRLEKNSKFEQNQYAKQLKFYLGHHISSLRFLENFRDLYSGALLVQYVSSASICANMYALTENKNVKLQARLVSVIMTEILQLAFYCIPVDYVTQAALEVSQAIYNSGWYLQHCRSLKNLVTVGIQRSQREVMFRAGGFIDFNSRTLVTILRTCWSICAVMKHMKSTQS